MVVVAYGDEDDLRVCLRTLGPAARVVVVDNGRSEPARAASAEARATYELPPANLGFAAAVNLALRQHRRPGTDVLLLNPDARLGWSEVVVLHRRLAADPSLAAVGPLLVHPDGRPQAPDWPVPSPLVALAAVVGAADRVTRRRFVTGAVLLLRAEAIDDVGLFDERFFVYAEETDWQLRALRAGWRVAVVREVCALHTGGATSSDPVRRELLFHASGERFARKWYGWLGWQVVRVANLLAATRRLLTSGRARRAEQRRLLHHYWEGPVRAAGRAGLP